MKAAAAIALGTLGLLLSAIAFCALLGLGVLREAPAAAVGLSALLLLLLPMTGISAMAKPRWASALAGAVIWPLLLLMGLPVYFPGERAPALSSGMGALAAPLGSDRSAAAATFGETISRALGPELLAGHPPHPVIQPQAQEALPEPSKPTAVSQAPAPPAMSSETIALPYEGEGRSLRVPVTFESGEGEQEFWMLFDTGATYTTLTTAALAQLGHEIPRDAPTAKLHTANGVTEAPLVLLDTVWLGGFPVHQVTIAVCDLCGSQTSSGLLGLNVSAQFRVTFDPGERMLELKPQLGDRSLDMAHWVDIQTTANAYPDGRIQVQVRAENISSHDMGALEVGIQCESERFTAHIDGVEAGERNKTTVSLPRGTACDPYQVSFDAGQWR